MGSYIRIQKVCEECGREFTARTTVTRCCGDPCAKRLYKRKKRTARLETIERERKKVLVDELTNQTMKSKSADRKRHEILKQELADDNVKKELLNLVEMAFVIGISKRTLQRLLRDERFPRFRLGKRIVFQKNQVLHYLHQTTSNHERKIKRETIEKRS